MWTGNPNNPAPNSENEGDNRGSELRDTNRAHQVRRDTDTQKDFTITLMDIDTVIINHVESLEIQLTDDGSKIKLPVFFGSPENWKASYKDGVIRDYNGKLILPAMVLKRTSTDKDESLRMFNRYLKYSVLRKYSSKNRYTPFNILIGKNAPISEVYDVVFPDHMTFTYHFTIWTEYVEQMNKVVETVNFAAEDYWGTENGLRFRAKVDSFQHTTEVVAGEDRAVRTEFDLIVNGYLLPDAYKTMKGFKPTTQKSLTPKKVVIGLETVATDFNPNGEQDRLKDERTRNQKYPNLKKSEIIPPPPIVPDPDSDIK